MKLTKTISKKNSWQRMIHNARGLLGRLPLATGVDMGSQLVKVVVLQAERNGLSLNDFSITPVTNSVLQDEPSATERVETMQERIAVPLSTIGTSLSGPSVFVKSIILPLMAEEDVREHLSLELDRYITLDVHDVLWDIYPRKSSDDATEKQQEYFLVVAKKESVEHQVEMFHQSGETVQFVDVDVFALINVVTYNYGKQGTWLLAHMGPSGIVTVVIVEGEPAYIHKVAYEAERHRDALGRVLSPQTSLESKKELKTSEEFLLERFFQETREQICDTLESFSEHSSIVIDRGILLSGGYAAVPEMSATLTHSLGMPVHLVDPFQAIVVPHVIQQDPTFQRSVPLMSVAVGVALRGALTHD